MKPLFALGLAAVASGVCAGAVGAQTQIDDTLSARSTKRLDQMEKVVKELRAIVFQGRDTGQPVVVQPADTNARLDSQADRLEDLDRSLSRLNGQFEVLRHDLDEVRTQASSLSVENAALNDRLSAAEAQIRAASAPAVAPDAGSQSDSPEAAFRAARQAFLAGDDTTAEGGFRAYVDRYGDTPQAPEAHYYLGRILIARQAFAEAATAEISAIRGWPQTGWAPAAVLDLSRALHGMGKDIDACQTLGELARRYPHPPRDVGASAAALRRQSKCV